MKKIKYLYQLTLLLFMTGLISCNDWFDLRPKSETILEDYWKDQSDVLSVVGSCYRAMNEPAFMERLIVWGEVRSDNVIQGLRTSDNGELAKIMNLTLNMSNGYTSWGDFYKVINYCNNVIHFAPEVKAKDPNYLEGQYRSHVAEAKWIRAFCYFTLVRTFRDIPLITEPTIDDTQPLDIPQSKPEEVIDFLIDDLKGIETWAVSEYNDIAYDKGRVTQKAVKTLIADMYLWRNNYDGCIEYCNKILNALNGLDLVKYPANYNTQVFINGNSRESIFELQFLDYNIPNYVVYEMYSSSDNGGPNRGQSRTLLSSNDFINKISLFKLNPEDLRSKDAFSQEGSILPIRKYTTTRYESGAGSISYYMFQTSSPNWIIYRLSDIYLMKAEALVEQNKLSEAFTMIKYTYDRSNPGAEETLDPGKYTTQQDMRNLVLEERQREFLFEGKRYFDLIRSVNREDYAGNVVGKYLLPKYVGVIDENTAATKLSSIDALYMPIHENEMKFNSKLKQNPFYEKSSDINKK